MRYMLLAFLVSSIFAAPGKFTGGNSLRAYMDFVRKDPAVLRKLRKVSRVFQQVMSHETGAVGTDAVLLYGGKVCVDFTKPDVQKLCDLLTQERALAWIKEICFKDTQKLYDLLPQERAHRRIKEICFKDTNNKAVKEIIALHKDNLRVLRFEGYDFEDEDIELPKTLQALYVWECRNVVNSFYGQMSFDEDLVDQFQKISIHEYQGLKKLYLRGHGFTGKDVVFRASLEELDISYCKNLDPHLQLMGCTRLKKLNAHDSNFTGKDVVFPPSLEELYISWCKNLDPHLQLSGCTQLKKLVAYSSNFTGTNVVFPASLEELYIEKCYKLDPHLQLNGCTRLKKLNVHDSNFTGKDVVFPPSLEELYISECDKLDPRLQLNACSQLKMLYASYSTFTGKDVILPASLEELWISQCYNLDPAFFHQLQDLPHLKRLSVKGTSFPKNMVLPGVDIYR